MNSFILYEVVGWLIGMVVRIEIEKNQRWEGCFLKQEDGELLNPKYSSIAAF